MDGHMLTPLETENDFQSLMEKSFDINYSCWNISNSYDVSTYEI